MTWLGGIYVSRMVKMYSLEAGAAAVVVEMSVAQMLKMHLSFVKVYVAVLKSALKL